MWSFKKQSPKSKYRVVKYTTNDKVIFNVQEWDFLDNDYVNMIYQYDNETDAVDKCQDLIKARLANTIIKTEVVYP